MYQHRTATKNQFTVSDKLLIFAEWVVIITSLGDEYSAETLLAMYRTRWQVELLFKRLKQFFKVQKLAPATIRHSTVMVLLWLIIWAATEKQSLAMEIYFAQNGEDMSRYFWWWVKMVLKYICANITQFLHNLEIAVKNGNML